MINIKITDISQEINNKLKIYEGDPKVCIEPFCSIDERGYALTSIKLGSHSGTHIDAPSHTSNNGANVSEIPLYKTIGKCRVIDINRFNAENFNLSRRILLSGCTQNNRMLSEEEAAAIVENGVVLVGTDAITIGSIKTHKILSDEGCVILEYLKLDGVAEGDYFLCALPLKINTDGAPCRACLISDFDASQY